METKLIENRNKYQMLVLPSDIENVTLSNGSILKMTKYTSLSGKSWSWSATVDKNVAEDVFCEIVGKRFELVLTINSDGTIATQKVNVNGGNPKGYFTYQNPLNYISKIN